MEVVRLLVTAGAKVNSKDDLGYMPLSYTAYNGHLEAVKLLKKWKGKKRQDLGKHE